MSHERSITIEVDGRFVNIPTVVEGQQLTDSEAIQRFRAGTIQPLNGFFDLESDALAAASQRSRSFDGEQEMTDPGQGGQGGGFIDGLKSFFDVQNFGNPDVIPFEQREGQIKEGLKSLRAGNLRGGRAFLKNGFNNMSPEEQQALLAGLSPADAQLVQSNVDEDTGPGGIAQAFRTLFGGEQR